MTYLDKANEPDPREQKLPAWARQKLNYLRHSVEVYRKKAAEANPITKDTLVVTDRYDEHPTPVKLGKRDAVTFYVDRFDSRDSFDVRVVDDHLEIYGSDQLTTYGRSGNVIELYFKDGPQERDMKVRVEAAQKGWSADEIRLGKHLGHIPHRNDVTPRTQAEIEAGR